jgi:ubiquinone/menaquinone biosynthesis C-methylase UbiE
MSEPRPPVQAEFARQAPQMASAPAFSDAANLQRICEALGQVGPGRVLEIACGPGIVAEAIAPLVGELICFDATSEMLSLAEARLCRAGMTNVAFRQGFVEELPFAPSEFDAVVTRLSFHHFADIRVVLREIRRVLRPRGRLIAADVISSSNLEESLLHNAIEQLRDPTHVHMFSRQELVAALRADGFDPQHEETWEQRRSFEEWARIIDVPTRMQPLREVMRTLCRAELKAGIDLHEVGGEIHFRHTWLLVVAEAVRCTES